MTRFYLHMILIVAIAAVVGSCRHQARSDIRKGNELFSAFKYEEALKYYSKAYQKDPLLTASQYNMAAALCKTGRFDSAVVMLQRLSDQPQTDSTVKRSIRYNLATTRLAWAVASKQNISKLMESINDKQQGVDEQMEVIEKVKMSIELDSMVVLQDSLENTSKEMLYKCIKEYKLLLKFNPKDSLSKFNLAYAENLLPKADQEDMKNKEQQQKESLTAYARKLKTRADSLVKSYVFDTAYHIMDKGVKKDTTVKTYNEYINKLKNVNDIKYGKHEKK